MSHLHKADVCLNHTLALVVGHSIPDNDGCAKDTPTIGLCKIYTKLLSFLEPPSQEDKYFESSHVHNISGHNTSISSLVKGGKRYVWYNNSNGYGPDTYGTPPEFLPSHTLEEEPLYEFIGTTTRELYVGSQIEDIKLNVPASLQDKLTESIKLKLLGRRLHHMMANLKNRGGRHAVLHADIMRSWTLWSYPNGDFNAPHSIIGCNMIGPRSKAFFIGKTEPHLPVLHIMGILQLLKLMSNSEHLVVVHPYDSMHLFGPQYGSSTDAETDEMMEGTSIGACVLWSALYMRKARQETAEWLENPVQNESEILEIIKNTLPSDPLDGEPNKQLYLAKSMQEVGGQKEWKTILSAVYDMIPGIEPGASEGSRLKTSWHNLVLYKLDQIETFVDGKFFEMFGYDLPEDTMTRLEPVCVAAFIEGIYIVSSAEARTHPTYLEYVGRIAAFVVENHMNNFHNVQFFIKMLKLLMACKHDESVTDDSARGRERYQPLSAHGESGKEYLKNHAVPFKYGAVNDSGFTEDPRTEVPAWYFEAKALMKNFKGF